jgi:hypothetical protein
MRIVGKVFCYCDYIDSFFLGIGIMKKGDWTLVFSMNDTAFEISELQ